MDGFPKVAPYLTDPLVLIGFALFVTTGLMKVVLSTNGGGLLRPLNGRQSAQIIQSMMRYLFILAVLITLLGFGLKGYQDYKDRPYALLQKQTKELKAEFVAQSKTLLQIKTELDQFTKMHQGARSEQGVGGTGEQFSGSGTSPAESAGEVGTFGGGAIQLPADSDCQAPGPRELFIAQDSVNQLLSKTHFLDVTKLTRQIAPLAGELRDLRNQVQRACEVAIQSGQEDTPAYKNLVKRAVDQVLSISKLADKASQYAKSFDSREEKIRGS